MEWNTFQKNLQGKFTPGDISRIQCAYEISLKAYTENSQKTEANHFEKTIRCTLAAFACGESDVQVIILLLLYQTVETSTCRTQPLKLSGDEEKFWNDVTCRLQWLRENKHPQAVYKDARTKKAEVYLYLSADEAQTKVDDKHITRLITWLISDTETRYSSTEKTREKKLIERLNKKVKEKIRIHKGNLHL